MKILQQTRITPGGLHVWYATDAGFEIRKQVGEWHYAAAPVVHGRRGFWASLWLWIKSW